jgi:signal transduction histidine kinase/AraC-like DNA-binding protein
VTLVPVPLLLGRTGDESLGFLENLRAQEMGALITPGLAHSQMFAILEAGLPIVCADETPQRHPWLVSPQGLYEAAVLATRFLAEQLHGAGHVLLAGGPTENPHTAQVRIQGFLDTLASFPDLSFTRIPSLWRYEEVYEQMLEEAEHWRRTFSGGPVSAVFGLSDPIALAARDAGRALGFVDARTLVAGINGDPLAIAAILEGTMHATAATAAVDLGCKLVEFGERAALRKPLPPTFPFAIGLVTPANVAQVAARKLVDIAALPSQLVDLNVQQETQRLKQMETSLELNRHVGSILDQEELLRTLSAIIRDRYAYDSVQFFLWSAPEQRLVLVDPAQAAADRLTVPLPEAGALGQALLRNQAVYIPDTQDSRRFAPDPRWPDVRARVILPVRVGGRTLGLLDLHSRNRTVRNQVELDALQTLADQVGSAMRNAQLYARARASTAEAERASRMKSRLLANISHELRGPLNVILGYSQAALEEPNPYGISLPRELVEDLGYIERSGAGLLRLINDLLDLAQAQAGTLPLYPETIASNVYLAQVFANAERTLARERDVQWKLHLPAALPSLYADPIRLRSVLLNLLDNAAKFTARGQITLGAEHRDTRLYLYVQDTGCGIAPGALAELRLGLAAGSESEVGAGARHIGLGLDITRHLVVLHGGEFQIESELGRGTICHVYLPLRRGPQGEPGGADSGVAAGAVPVRTTGALVKKVQEFVAANYSTAFSRADLADRLGVSEAYVSRIFRQVTGTALWDYVNHYRVARACELLDRTTSSITEVALAVGFNDPAYFSRVFRKETGQSPQSYRRGVVQSN